jgi:hypothetical protein
MKYESWWRSCENRRTAITSAVPALTLLLFITAWALLPWQPKAVAQTAKEAKVLEAQEFRLVGEDGQVRARLSLQNGRPGLDLFDDKHVLRASLVVGNGEEGGRLILLNANGKMRASLGLTGGEGPCLVMCDADEKPRIFLGLTGDVPTLGLTDKTGKPSADFTVIEKGARLRFLDATGKSIWSTPGEK